MNFGLPELLIILVIVLILFGSTRLPKLARSVGQSMHEMREGFSAKGPPKPKEKPAETKKPEETPQAQPAQTAETSQTLYNQDQNTT
jgi:sec-independent protein translocase protein TatA